MFTGFTKEVQEQLKYYVYRLIDPRNGETFYVGKGKDNRVFDHVNDALKDLKGAEDEVSAKIQQIRDIRNSGLSVIHIIQRYGMNEAAALEVEAALIDCYQGLTNIQSGHSSDRGVNNAEVLQRDLSCSEFDENINIKYCIIKIKDYSINERGSIYEAVRKHWKVNLSRVNKIPYVLACRNGVVLDVFEVEKWYESDEVPGRYMFNGHPAEDKIRNQFKNKRIPVRFRKKGMASPVLYHDKVRGIAQK